MLVYAAMKTLKEIKKSDRGSFDFRSDGKVYFCRWNNNSVINIVRTYAFHLPVEIGKRRVKRDSNVSITQPNLIEKCNLDMRCVDVMDC